MRQKKEKIQRSAKIKPKKPNKTVYAARLYIYKSPHNFILSASLILRPDVTICWTTGGICDFHIKGRASTVATHAAMHEMISKLKNMKANRVSVILRGLEQCDVNLDIIILALRARKMRLLSISDRTSVAHNGCRLRGTRNM